jgi:hypothetical protein
MTQTPRKFHKPTSPSKFAGHSGQPLPRQPVGFTPIEPRVEVLRKQLINLRRGSAPLISTPSEHGSPGDSFDFGSSPIPQRQWTPHGPNSPYHFRFLQKSASPWHSSESAPPSEDSPVKSMGFHFDHETISSARRYERPTSPFSPQNDFDFDHEEVGFSPAKRSETATGVKTPKRLQFDFGQDGGGLSPDRSDMETNAKPDRSDMETNVKPDRSDMETNTKHGWNSLWKYGGVEAVTLGAAFLGNRLYNRLTKDRNMFQIVDNRSSALVETPGRFPETVHIGKLHKPAPFSPAT